MATLCEEDRLARMAELGLLDVDAAPAVDLLARLAARLTGSSRGLVTLLDSDQQVFWGNHGMPGTGTPREIAFCDVVVATGEPLVVPDASSDPRFASNPLVTGPLAVRFYAGVPLTTDDGAVLGSVCVLDDQPRAEGVSEEELALLQGLAAQVLDQVRLRQALRALTASEAQLRALTASIPDVLRRHALDGTVLAVSDRGAAMLGHSAQDEIGAPASRWVHPEDAAAFARGLAAARGGGVGEAEHRTRHADGGWHWMESRFTPVLSGEDVLEIASVARDVTERVEAREARAEVTQARRALRSLDATLNAVEAELQRRQMLTDAVLETVDVGIVACDSEGSLTLFNAATRAFHGMPADPSLDPTEWADRYDLFAEDGHTPLTRDQVPLWRALQEGVVEDALITIAPHGLAPRRVRCDGRALHDEHGTLLGAVVAMADVTALEASERRFRAAFFDSPTPMAHLDDTGVVRDSNPALRRFLAVPSSRLEGSRLAAHVQAEDRVTLQDALLGPGTGERPVEVRMVRADGTAVWCELATTRSTDGAGGEHVLAQLLDVHGRKVQESALEDAARRDPLTGLGNRTVLAGQLQAMLDPVGGTGGALLVLDLDGFKAVNDQHGHEAGDAVLVEVAQRLLAVVRPHDVVVRQGGDEFVVLCRADRAWSTPGMDALARRIEGALDGPFRWEGTTLTLAGSVGWAAADAGDDPQERLDAADRAMYARKRERRARVPGRPPA